MKSKVAFHTLGCKLNFAETSTIGEQFLQNGFDIVDYSECADVYVINTCSVTNNADIECRQIIRRALRNNPDAFVIVTGCYAQLRAEEISKIEGVNVILGSNEKFKLFEYIKTFDQKDIPCIHVSPAEELNTFFLSSSTEADERTRAFLKIQDGCGYKCSFCTIPLARGKSRSADPNEVISEFKKLLHAGYKEIILTGVNVGDYQSNINYDLIHNLNQTEAIKDSTVNLNNLLKMMFAVEGDYRIRISSIEPNLLNNDIINITANNEKMCNHFHIPLQSGSDKILRLMQRRYKTEDYKALIYDVIKKIENVAIGVDVIAGFPGETEDDFLGTYNFLKELPIAYLHVFTYSERPNTKAIQMAGQVEVTERKRRNNMLRILSEKKRNQFYRRMKGKELIVLFENENVNGFIKGFSSNYVRVKLPYDKNLENNFVKVKIMEIDGNIATAEVITRNI